MPTATSTSASRLLKRTNLALLIILLFELFATTAGALFLGASSISDRYVNWPASSLVFLYAAYWAFSIGRRLRVALYRRQAFGIGLVAIGFGVVFTALLPFVDFPPRVVITWFVFMFWIDASVLAGRRSDPLLRDLLYWRRGLRYLPYALMISALAGFSLQLPGFVGTNTPYGLGLFLYPALVSGVILVPLTARRSADVLFRRQMMWFGLFIAVVLIGGLVEPALSDPTTHIASTLPSELVTTILVFAQGICLYRSARSLVPLNRLPVPEN